MAYTPVQPSPLGPVNCNCACQRCLDGGCCMVNPAGTQTITWTTTTPQMAIRCGAMDHNFGVLDPARIYCRKCGEVRKV